MAFRMDDRKQRIIVHADGGEGIDVFGWEAADAAALDALAARLEKSGTKVARGSRALADERLVKDLIVFNDPLGNRGEIFHGAQVASDPFVPGRAISGFRTGPLGLGHVVFNVETSETIQKLLPFYRDVLGFRLTDYYSHPFEAYFLHVNPRHHSLAFIRTGKNAVHHIMMEVFSFDDIGQGYDIALGEGRVATTLGRHTSDFITSFYTWTPSGFMVEYGWGARDRGGGADGRDLIFALVLVAMLIARRGSPGGFRSPSAWRFAPAQGAGAAERETLRLRASSPRPVSTGRARRWWPTRSRPASAARPARSPSQWAKRLQATARRRAPPPGVTNRRRRRYRPARASGRTTYRVSASAGRRDFAS